ncbi:MAG: hypothetical protein H7203_03375 [Rhizobacter sp.]|nr:hypothetical protein [Burkholderiales bacterium]
MLLLPGSLPADRATLKALCLKLEAPANIAAWLRTSLVEPFSGSWSSAEREALGLTGDLGDGQKLAEMLSHRDLEANQYAVATPLHAALGLTDLTPIDPALIALNEIESRALCDAADAHLAVDGVRLFFADANTWLVRCASEINVLSERPDWLIGEPLRPNLPRGKDARLVERWMNELQMLLFAHPVNAAREERGLPAINVVWLWGFGPVPPLPQAGEGWSEGGRALATTARTPGAGAGAGADKIVPASPDCGSGAHASLDFVTALRNGNVSAWQNAWQARSTEILAADSIILGNSRPRLRLTPRKASTVAKLTAVFRRQPTLTDVLSTLQQQL